VNVTGVLVETPPVVTVAEALVKPAGTVTDDAVAAADPFELESATTIPPVGAAAVSETPSVEFAPPFTDVGESETP
jgi:hypothetical protein